MIDLDIEMKHMDRTEKMKDEIYCTKCDPKESSADYINEIRNILKYTLRIDEIQDDEITGIMQSGPSSEKERALSIIDAVKSHTDEACKFLLENSSDFFGDTISRDVFCGELASKGTRKTMSLQNLISQSFFHDALLSVYAYLRKTLCSGTLSGYGAFKATHYIDVKRKTGLDYLIKNGWCGFEPGENCQFALKKKEITNSETAQIAGSADHDGRGSPFRDRLIAVDKLLCGRPEYEKTVEVRKNDTRKTKSGKSQNEYFVNSDGAFVGSILCSDKVNLKHLVGWAEGNKTPTRAELRNALASLKSEFLYSADFCLSDDAYLESEIEKLFHGEVLESLWINMREFEKRHGVEFGLGELQGLALCMKLPLTPERPDIIRYAFDQKIDGSVSRDDFFSALDKKNVEVYYATPTDKSRTMALWLNRYRYMMNYLTDFAYPVYRSVFLASMYKVISKIEQPENIMDIFSIMYNCLCDRINFEHTDKAMQEKYGDPLCQLDKRAGIYDSQSEGESKNADKAFGSFYKNCNSFFRGFGSQNDHCSFLTLKGLDYLSSNTDQVVKFYNNDASCINIPDVIAEARNIFAFAAAHYKK